MRERRIHRVLVVDDEENIRVMLATVLGAEGIDVVAAGSAEQALAELSRLPCDVLITDVRMPRRSGMDLLADVKRLHPDVVVIVMSAYGTVDSAIEAIQQGAYDYIAKPFKPAEITLLLRKVEERERLRQENRELRRHLQQVAAPPLQMIARSPAMQRVLRTVQKIAEYKTTVLILGESGTGKELVARALHRSSDRGERAFVALNCGAIPESLLESELFGHRKGAFTDATRDKQGLFAAADGGTLFLDEVGELPLSLQVKLLRVLQEGVVRAVGDTREATVDVRVVAATSRDLQQEVAAGRFREDLYYRLNVLPLILPPLRERTEDIPALIEHFIARTNTRLGTALEGVAPDAFELLLAHAWPGNVRELENTIEHAMVLAEGHRIDVVSLPAALRRQPRAAELQLAHGEELSIKKATRAIEEALIRRALQHTGGNRTAAAKLLEISHRALLYKIRDYGVGNGE